MYLITNQQDWPLLRAGVFPSGATVGFVPTMGALHAGHLTLIERSVRENDVTVCSIFVNPTQFNEESDLANYPRTLPGDMDLAEKGRCNVIFLPSVSEMYGEHIESIVADYGTLTNTLEGAHRPGHFDGMVTIVRKLLEAISPDRAYFGEKDFQQLSIIKELVVRESLPVEIVPCELIREESGLAMSSRNVRLSEQGRNIALSLSATLNAMRTRQFSDDPAALKSWGANQIVAAGLRLDYLEIVDANTFEPIEKWEDREMRILVAAWVEGVRLIDNIDISKKG
jgi:pantoate--beta-alanine ligase